MTQSETSIQNLRILAKKLFAHGVNAADPEKCLQSIFDATPLPKLKNGRYLVIAFGKAAMAMTRTTLKALPKGVGFKAICVTNYENAGALEGAIVFAAGHPVPDTNGEVASTAIIKELKTTTKDDVVLVLISGGGSALLPAPIDGISLDDKIAVNKLLLANGYAIHDMNLIRQTLSKLKGGGLSQLAAPATVQSYILSDVVGDDLSVIASGPTNPPLGTAQDALKLFKAKGLTDKLPKVVQDALSQAATQQAPDLSNTRNQLVGSNRMSLDAIMANLPDDWHGKIVSDHLEGDVAQVASQLAAHAQRAEDGKKTALIWGGETTVTLTGNGKGGRNQELALRFAKEMEHHPIKGTWTFLSGGTDGRDGPTDSAGGVTDTNSLARIQSKGADITQLLANNDSYKALALSGDHLMTGATGTNVADIQICLIDRTNNK